VGDCDELITKAGLAGLVTKEGIASFGPTLSVGGALTGALVGIFFSEMMAALLGVLGFALGFTQAKRSLGHEREKRSEMVERDLSQCLEVIVLGLRSGLSFDRSLAFYQEYFDGGLSRATSLAQTQWSYGLLSRTEGLRSLAASYDSDLFERTVEGIIRSLRFGTSLSSDLSEQAASARASRRAKLEERVAKAPVKMLLPVGVLILPAMLMLVLGPILLELMNGF
jgi:tight adherence protein C